MDLLIFVVVSYIHLAYSYTVIPKELSQSMIKKVYLKDSRDFLLLLFKENIILLAKNRAKPIPSSSVYFSYDGGDTYHEIQGLLSDDKEAVISLFYTSPAASQVSFFSDIINNYLFVSKNMGLSFNSIKLKFKPQQIFLNKYNSNKLLAYDFHRLWYSKNLGINWTFIADNVHQVRWGNNLDDIDTIFLLTTPNNGLSTLLSSSDFFIHNKTWLNNVYKFVLDSEYLIVMQKLKFLGGNTKNSAHLWISFKRAPLKRAIFPFHKEKEIIDFHCIDLKIDVLLIAASYNDSSVTLFVGNIEDLEFMVSLENIVHSLSDNNHVMKASQSIEIHKVSGFEGVYLANYYRDKFKNETLSVITYDNGFNWKLLPVPFDKNGTKMQCISQINCSLHLIQKHQRSSVSIRYPSILSHPSSIGLIISPGIVNSFDEEPNVFLSLDAGISWRQILSGNYLFQIADYGSIIMGVKRFFKSETTNKALLSFDYGKSWSEMTFMSEGIRVLNLLNVPSSLPVFFIFGSLVNSTKYEWIIIKINITSMLKEKCPESAYEYWYPRGADSQCILGKKKVYWRRKQHSPCINWKLIEKPIQVINCSCAKNDYFCDVGYKKKGLDCVIYNKHKMNESNECPKKRSKGYRRIFGDTCKANSDFEPELISCEQKFKESNSLDSLIAILVPLSICFIGVGIYTLKSRNIINIRDDHNQLNSAWFAANASFGKNTGLETDLSDDEPLVVA